MQAGDNEILNEVEGVMSGTKELDTNKLTEMNKSIRDLGEELNAKQVKRIRDGESKTRLSILYYALIGNCLMISKQNLKLLKIFAESFSERDIQPDDDFE